MWNARIYTLGSARFALLDIYPGMSLDIFGMYRYRRRLSRVRTPTVHAHQDTTAVLLLYVRTAVVQQYTRTEEGRSMYEYVRNSSLPCPEC